MALKEVNVIGEGTFQLPEGRLCEVFEEHHNVAIIDPAEREAGNGLGVIDSVHLRAYRTTEERQGAIVSLLERHGATRVPAHNSAVA